MAEFLRIKMKKLTNIIAVLIVSTSCSKTVTEIRSYSPQSETLKVDETTKVNLLNELINSDAPNLALADVLSRSLGENRKQIVQSIVGELTPEEAKSIILDVQKKNQQIKKNYLFHGEAYQQNNSLIEASLLNKRVNSHFKIEDQLKVGTFNYLKSKHLDEIIMAFDKRANELASELAQDVAIEIAQNNPQSATEIEQKMRSGSSEDAVKAIEKTKEFMSKADEYFKNSGLNENEQYAVIASGIIAFGVYEAVKENEGFKRILEESKKIIKDAQEIQRKAKEFTILIGSLKKHFKETEKNVSDLTDGLSGVGKDLDEMYKEAKTTRVGPSNIHSKRIFDFLYRKVIKGENADPSESNESILSKQGKINANLQKSVDAAGNIADNLTNIIGTANKLSMLFGVKPSSDLQKVMDKAQKVSQLVTTAKNVMTGWMSGGALGAVTALSVSPIPGLNSKSAESAKLDQISKKLDIVISNQKKIMEMQIETMNMIKNLALLIDQYHQEEMRALSELREIGLVNLELNKALQNKDLRNCERMVNFQLRSVWTRFDFQKDSFHSIGQIPLINTKFLGNIQSLRDIQRIITSVEESGFSHCQTGLAEAFGGNSTAENPVRIIYESNEDSILTKFQKERYLPLVSLFDSFVSAGDMNTIPLHLPVSSFSELKFKTPYVDYPNERANSTDAHYELDYLISVRNLERYLSYLLILHPFLEVDKPIWMQSFNEIVETYLSNSNSQSNQNMRSHFFLNNALRLVQSAIAQESILAGEPLVHRLHDLYFTDILSSESCEKVKLKDTPDSEYPLLCSIRGNKLLMKNLLHYSIAYKVQREPQVMDEYELAYKEGNVSKMALILNAKLNPGRIKYVKAEADESFFLSIVLEGSKEEKIRLPSPNELKKGELLFSENMLRLFTMQDAVIEALTNVAPVSRENKNSGLLKLMMMKD